MRLTNHARERWQQRCSHLDLDTEVANSRRAGKAVLNKLRRGWEAAQGVGTWPAEHAYLVTPGGCLFVVSEGIVITVMLVKEIKGWDSRRDKDERDKRRHRLL